MEDVLWRTAKVDAERASVLAKTYDLPIRVAKWLCARNMDDNEIAEWLSPSQAGNLRCEFRDMGKAVQRVLAALRASERICVVGDYDVDGVTASAILASALRQLNADWHVLIPHRVQDGYGLSEKMVDRAIGIGAKLLITVDNGIRAHEAIRYAVEQNLDVIVTDHHEPGNTLPPDALAIVHWALSDDPDAPLLSGAAVSLQLASALLEQSPDANATDSTLTAWHHGLAALGAIADMMPMRRINRRLVQEGLSQLRTCSHPGWLALCDTAGVSRDKLDDVKVSWSIAPRLNAAGRIGSAETAFQLLTATDTAAAARAASAIESCNEARKVETERAYQAAERQAKATLAAGDCRGFVLDGPWHLGVVGIVAAKVVNSFERPTIVFSDDGSDVLKGSGRAPKGFPLYDAVNACHHLLEHFGGHEAAIGCAVHRSQLSAFRVAFQKCVIDIAGGQPSVEEADVMADDYLPLSEVSLELLSWLNRFRPFGTDNPPFTFYVGPVEVVQLTPMSNGKHGRLRVKESGVSAELVWFNMPEEAKAWPPGACLGAIVELTENEWQGVRRPQLRVLDAHRLYRPLRRDDFSYMYRLLRAHRKIRRVDFERLSETHTPVETETIFETFVELGFAHFAESAYHVVEQVIPRDLRDSPHYQKHLRNARFTQGR